MEAVFLYQMDLVPQLEAQIWPLLLQNPSFGPRLFSSLLNTGRHGAKALQFLEIWRFCTNLADLPSLQQFYSGILRAYKAQLTPELELGIQANFLALTEQNWAAFYTVLQNSEATYQRMMQFFDHWLQAPHLPATRDLPVNTYYNYISAQEIKTQLPDENKVWRALIRHDGNTGFNLFNFLMTQGSQANKLFQFIECWLSQLSRDTDVIQAYKYLKLHITETVLQDCKAEIRKLAELRIQELRYENKGIENVKDTTKWLKKSHPGFFSCSSATAATTSYSVFKLMEKNKPAAQKALREEKEETAESINTKLVNKGEETQFKFKP